MIELVRQIISYYIKNKKEPSINDLNIKDKSLLNIRWCVFVTIYKNWEIRWSAWNTVEFESSIVNELIKSTIECITNDSRFKPLTLEESKEVKIRVDIINDKIFLNSPKNLDPSTWKIKELKNIDPVKSWILAIKKDYENLAVILPNINNTLLNWDDFIKVLKAKLWDKDFDEKNYILYEIKTETLTSY